MRRRRRGDIEEWRKGYRAGEGEEGRRGGGGRGGRGVGVVAAATSQNKEVFHGHYSSNQPLLACLLA